MIRTFYDGRVYVGTLPALRARLSERAWALLMRTYAPRCSTVGMRLVSDSRYSDVSALVVDCQANRAA